MRAATREQLRGLLSSARRFPCHRQSLLWQALRIAQQALARDAGDREAIKWLGVVWYRLGEVRRGRALLQAAGKLKN